MATDPEQFKNHEVTRNWKRLFKDHEVTPEEYAAVISSLQELYAQHSGLVGGRMIPTYRDDEFLTLLLIQERRKR
jgi:hypothetical protein